VAGKTVSIFLNGDEIRIDAGWTVLDLVEKRLRRDPRTVAVEYNGNIVARQTYGDCRIEAGDRLEVVHFVQGG